MYFFYYGVEEWGYSQPLGSEPSINFRASPTRINSKMPPLHLTLLCAEDKRQTEQPLGAVEIIDLGPHYDVEKFHEGCISVAGSYFQELKKALFATGRSKGFSVEISIGLERYDLSRTEILDFDFEVSCERLKAVQSCK